MEAIRISISSSSDVKPQKRMEGSEKFNSFSNWTIKTVALNRITPKLPIFYASAQENFRYLPF